MFPKLPPAAQHHDLLKLTLGGNTNSDSLYTWQWLRDHLPRLINLRQKILGAITSGLVLEDLREELFRRRFFVPENGRRSERIEEEIYSDEERALLLSLLPNLLHTVGRLREVTVDVEDGSVLRKYVNDGMFVPTTNEWAFGPKVKTFVLFGKNGVMDAALKAAIGFHNEVL